MGDGEGVSLKRPEWLPDGWIMKVNRRKDGKLDKYYLSPESGFTFRSKPEVMRYLNVEKVDGPTPVTAASSEENKYHDVVKIDDFPPGTTAFSEEDLHRDVEKVDGLAPVTTAYSEEHKHCVDGLPLVTTESSEEDKHHDVEHGNDSPPWLPSGWILEIRTRKTGAKAGTKYKCYRDPSTGSRFYSKAEVFRYLKDGKYCKSTLKGKKLNNAEPKENYLGSSTSNQKSINADSKDDIPSLVETSPVGLPSGWIKEIRCKWNASGFRKDPYYIDPVSGYVFRSKKDALRYIETGEISKHAIKPKTKGSVDKMHFVEYESPLPISAKKMEGQGAEGTEIRRRLFAGKVRKSNKRTTQRSDVSFLENSCLPLADQVLFHCEQGSGPSCKGPSDVWCLKDKQAKAVNQAQDQIANLHENELPDKLLEPADEKALDQVIEKVLDSVSKKPPGSSDGKLSYLVSETIQNASNMEWLGALGKEKLILADKIVCQSTEAVGDVADPPPRKQLKFKGGKAHITAKRKSPRLVEPTSDIIMEPSSEPQKRGDDNKIKLADRKSSNSLHRNPLLEEMKGVEVESFVLEKAAEVGLQNGKLFEPEGKTSGLGIEESKREGASSATRRPQPRGFKAKSEKSPPVTCRASKRLAGQEADPAADIEVSDRSLKRAKYSIQSENSSAKVSFSVNGEVETKPSKLKDELLGDKVYLEELGGVSGSHRTANEDSERPVASPFGDSWPDACIEFAFKTLTGEIPVMDPTTIQGFLHEQISSVQTPTPDGPHSLVDGYLNGQDQAGVQKQVNTKGKDHSLLETPPRTGGRVKRLCRRSITRNAPCDA
uniref:Methyl-CpG-binding domain-containing protein 13 n=1 Tax=Anthurium amnicola TaxID=1678845 RepID=A0A1D1XZE7_9ARAE